MFLRVILSTLAIAIIALLSRCPSGENAEYGILRLSWRTAGEKVRTTIESPGEEVPTHMRPQQDYEEKMRDYQLTATIDGKPWLEQLMRPPGLHHDRPISVFEERPLPVGRYQVRVQFLPVPEDGATWKPELDTPVNIEAGKIVTLSITEQGEP